ncbi:Na(+)/citrate cotransporter-like [Dreissena polymorpha]|uniref:Uncharacterized protein n=1 Tax=Dreissena polymorpha TaxID=45954 RepID=A0A9D4F6L4_DREPO|nr:Na(+)/citrate cotransporter-like [Dreissena polymorpha]KAH3792226.1 hypothetical protein DPMN_145717 [Dreissena polymorpha]
MVTLSTIAHNLAVTKCVWITLLALILPCKLLFDYDPELKLESKCAYVIIVMAILWLTEAIPIPVTSLFPVFLFPMAGVMHAREASSAYFSDISMLLLGGLLIAMALEETNLHIRISLYVLVLVGAQPIMLVLGSMVTTWFLSFWINNTSATAMMMPIILAVCTSVREVKAQTVHVPTEECLILQEDVTVEHNVDTSLTAAQNGDTMAEQEPIVSYVFEDKQAEAEFYALTNAQSLSVAYGALCGGLATITGTPSNLVLKDVVDKFYRDHGVNESPISFTSWMAFGLPLSFLSMFIGWMWLSFWFLGRSCFKKMDPSTKKAINSVIRKRAKALGAVTFAEWQVVTVFVSMVIFWLFRNPPNIPGWGSLFKDKDVNNGHSLVSDSTPCILLSVILFILPEQKPNILWWRQGRPFYTPILKWTTVAKRLPWGVLILVGGGFAMAKASQESGLSKWIGRELRVFGAQSPTVMCFVVVTVVSLVTEVMSNPATAQLFVPIVRDMSVSLGVNPLYLMIASAVAASFAFMLPTGAPPTAIVFAAGYISIPNMALAGLPMKIIGICCTVLAVNTWGTSLFDLDHLQDFLKPVNNMTSVAMATNSSWNSTENNNIT